MPCPGFGKLRLRSTFLTAKRVQQRVVEKKRFAGGGCAALVSELALDFLTARRVYPCFVEGNHFAGGGFAASVSEITLDFLDRETRKARII